MPEHIEFYNKINFGYLMHLVGCFIQTTKQNFTAFRPLGAVLIVPASKQTNMGKLIGAFGELTERV
jgi:hypothetical protein